MRNRMTLYLVLIVDTLLFLQVTPAHASISIDRVTPETGTYGDTVVVVGSGATAGVDVNLYWDAVRNWDGEKGFLNSTEAEADGSYEVWFDVPEAVNGPHYIWVKDMDSGATAMYRAPSNMVAKIELDPSGGLPGDTITINGYGFGAEVEILLVWLTDGETVVLETSPSTPSTDEKGSWTATFEVPDIPYGSYEINAIDEEGNMVQASTSISHRVFNAPENSVYYVPTGNIYDNSALYAFYAFTVNPQIITPPTQSPASGTYLDEEGRPLFSGDIITFGGRLANRMVSYYEDEEIALVGYEFNGTHHVFKRTSDGTPIFQVEASSYNPDERDYFVFQTYMDGDRYVMSEWGISAEGTYAGGLCFIDKIFPNLNEDNQYSVYSWSDLNDDDIPQREEISLETSGT